MGWMDLKDHYNWVDIPKDGWYPISTKYIYISYESIPYTINLHIFISEVESHYTPPKKQLVLQSIYIPNDCNSMYTLVI